jgi:rhamnogalacturonan endolyase
MVMIHSKHRTGEFITGTGIKTRERKVYMKTKLRIVLVIGILFASAHLAKAQYLMENLGRGVVAIRQNATDVYVGWRLLGTDSSNVSFNLYRSTGGAPSIQINPSPITDTTNFIDTGADLTQSNDYSVIPVINGIEQAASTAFTLPANAPVQQYLNIPLQIPPDGTTPDGAYNYTANDASVGDLDGDGEYEFILKWDPSNSKDNSQSGYTGNVFLDAYKLDGTRLWRIDLGRNIRAGAHYTQFMVYDLDGDGKAEIACKTAPGTIDGQGQNVLLPGDDPNADYRNSAGYVLSGPEYLTVFNGLSGAAMSTVSFNPPRGTVTDWGDNYGNRVDRFLAGIAYLDGRRPSLVMARGYYTRAFVAAWDWRDGQLTNRWNFDSGHTGTSNPNSNWRGQGAHSLTIGDVDGDGRDEITYGAAAIDDDGSGLYSTLLGHGDALHMTDMDPTRPGQEVWMVHEEPGSYGPNGVEFRDAKTGALIFGVSGEGADVGRGVAGDIDPRYLGYEMWGSRGGLRSTTGALITTSRPSQQNFMVWWDGDLLREMLDNTTIFKWDWNTNTSNPILAPAGLSSNNGTKATPALSGDILGDWREEVVWRTADNTALRIYTTTIPATNRIYTLMHDHQYRVAIAWQNTAYNQPPHPSFYIGDGMSAPPPPNIVTSLAQLPAAPPAVNSINRFNPFSSNTGASGVTFRVTFNTPVTGVDTSDFTLTTTGSVTGSVTNVTALSGLAYNVTVGSMSGAGTVRLDLKAGGTGIADSGGAPISGGFTTGQPYNRVGALAWINPASGGIWSEGVNWDSGVIAEGLDSVPTFGSFDLLANNTVFLDSPRMLSGMTFSDANTASAASWIISDGGNSDNTLTLDVTSGVPAVTVNALGTGATTKIDASLAGNKGLAKAGAGTLEISKPVLITGQVNVNAGALRFGTGSSMQANTVSVASGTGLLDINGGSFTATGVTTVNGTGGSLILNNGTGTFGSIITNNTASGLIRVNGGTFNATSINIPRSSDATPSYAFGFVVTGGTSAVSGAIGVGTNNSWGSMSVEGGSLTVGGAVTVGNQTSSGRGGQLRVTNGSFNVTDITDGLILGRRAANASNALFSGGTSTFERIKLGFDSSVNSGTATLTVNGGSLYLGSGGLVKNGTSALTTTVSLQSGTLGAKANWATAVPLTLAGNINFKAADAAGAPFDITLNSVLSGTGSFTKIGTGSLILGGANTYTGTTDINAGLVRVDGSLSPGGGAVNVNSGGMLSGSGAVNRAVTLNSGGSIAPGGASSTATLSGTSLTWSSGGKLAFDLGSASDSLVLSGALTKSGASPISKSSGKLRFDLVSAPDLLLSSDALTKSGSGALADTYEFVFNPGAGFTAGATYTLATFGSTNFSAADFSYSGLPPGVGGSFQVNAGNLQFIILVPTAANVSISGIVQNQSGQAVSRAIVEMINQNGERKSTVTNTFGHYHFDEVLSGQTYTFRVSNKRRESVNQIVTVNDSISELNFVLPSD